MTSAAKRKGSSYERSIVQYLRECGFAVDRTRAGWSDDRGDIHGVVSPEGVPFVFECKNQRTLRLNQWTSELHAEISNAGGMAGVLVHKRHGSTSPEDQHATLPLGMLVQLLREAGYR